MDSVLCLHAKMTNHGNKLVIRVMRFGVTGGLTAVIYFVLIYLLVGTLSMNPTAASVISFALSILYNYLSHKYWSFESSGSGRTSHQTSLPRFAVVTTAGMGINSGIIYIGTEIVSAPFPPTQAVAVAALLVWNYLMFTRWVFSD